MSLRKTSERWRSTSATSKNRRIAGRSVLDDTPQSNPEIAGSSAAYHHVPRRLRCDESVLRERPAKARADFARSDPGEPRSGTAGLAAHSEWQPLLLQFDCPMERRGIAHHSHEQYPVTGHDYHHADFISRYRPDCRAHSCQPLRRPRLRQRRGQPSLDLYGHLGSGVPQSHQETTLSARSRLMAARSLAIRVSGATCWWNKRKLRQTNSRPCDLMRNWTPSLR